MFLRKWNAKNAENAPELQFQHKPDVATPQKQSTQPGVATRSHKRTPMQAVVQPRMMTWGLSNKASYADVASGHHTTRQQPQRNVQRYVDVARSSIPTTWQLQDWNSHVTAKVAGASYPATQQLHNRNSRASADVASKKHAISQQLQHSRNASGQHSQQKLRHRKNASGQQTQQKLEHADGGVAQVGKPTGSEPACFSQNGYI